MVEITYKYANPKKCYWLCLGCLKKHQHKCSMKCPDYLSVAKAKRLIRDKKKY